MTRNLKALGLALAAVFAMSAVVASAASAQGKLTASEPVTLTATETGALNANQLSAFGVAVRCPGSHYTGHTTSGGFIPSGATTATLTPEYTQTAGTPPAPNCSVPGLNWSATVDVNGCDFVGHIGATTGGAGTYAITFDVDCPTGQEITVTLWTTETEHTNDVGFDNPICVLHIGETGNQGLPGAHATNTTGGHIGIHGTVTGIDVTRTASASHPVLCGEATTATGTFNIDVTVSGHNEEEEEIPISLSD